MLNLKEITKTFGRVHALKGVSITVDVGEVVGLVGENGAGKSTLMKVLNGIHQPDSGTVEINGNTETLRGPRDAAAKGIGMVFQEQSLIPNISVAENIFIGNEAQFVRFGRIDWKAIGEAAKRQLDKVGLDVDPRTTTSALTFMQRQMVELAKVLTLEEAVDGNLCILLDEPTSVLEQAEIDILFGVIRKLRERAGIIFISHRLDEVIEISDTIYVMKDGAVVERLMKADATPERIHHLMVGREAAGSYYKQDERQPPAETVALSVQKASRALEFSEISFDVHNGEVLALVGTEGAGSEPLIRSFFGLERIHLGKIVYRGEDLTNTSPGRAVAAGIGYVPRERKIEGIVEEMSVQENICLPLGGRLTRFGLFDFGSIAQKTSELIAKLRIKTPDGSALCANLSGGNQQKVVLSKWYRTDARLFLLDHPTRGLDVGAKEDVYALIREMCAAGAAVVLIADTLEEALGLAHTVIVLKDGKQTARFDNTGPTPVTPLDLIPHMV
ncbi:MULTISPECIES: sugar ABC transporter ATP-binding protein [Agrobacterium]|uniref:Sugar ABC transporter ATP-binding protein n=1 Tax=Agrobacterium rubi TaxID=28099 RepID=A0AAE7RDL0_9HYPH|nr:MULTISPECIES: sugar ABC transporter ATP-binding protein [Agrobacterium]MBN7808897.1 sugar ABC transporter ATP-binding protein [Agrobacterium rosae]NTE90187.1 sugar ABC transporter ATP-binding protein [Agrobacterium rubi]NTF06006.1 sugar ABC transporter ATP-binding protein [Agrobacterium rubi]NTF40245.1 sugar ABC transporter ATP-binding protein [Agrobacterium rubi]OCJ53036.1 ABC transporter ATP-binding protein [Agrobacterium rubi]